MLQKCTLISQSKRDDSLIYVRLGDDYYKTNFYQGSSQMYGIAIKLNPQQHYQTYMNYEQGYSLYMVAKFEEAIQIYDQANYTLIKVIYIQYFIGDSLKKLQRFSEAIQMYDLAIQLDPQNCQGYLNKARILLEQKNTFEATIIYDQAIRLNQDIQLYLKIGNEYYEQRKYEEALYISDLIIKLYPNNYYSYFIKGDILIALNQSDGAMQIYDFVASLYPETQEYQKRGDGFYKQKKYKEAIQIYDILIKHHPNINENYLKKGDILFAMGNIEEANEIYNNHAGLLRFSNQFMLQFNKGGKKSNPPSNQYEEAIQFYQGRIHFYQGYFKFEEKDSEMQKGDLLVAQGKIQEGIQVYREAKYQNGNSLSYYQRGEKFYCQKLYEEAIQLCDIAIELNPKEYLAYLKKGDSLVELRRLKEAESFYQQSSQIWGKINIFYDRGEQFVKEKKYEAAIILFGIVIQLNPLSERGYLLKGHALIALGKFQEGLEMYDKSVMFLKEERGYKELFQRGEQFYNQQNYEEAIHIFDLILILDKKFNLNQYNVYLLKGHSLNALNRFQEALEMYNHAITLNVHECKFYDRGVQLYINGKFEQAVQVIEMYKQVFEKSHSDKSQSIPKQDWAYFQNSLLIKGDSLLQLGRIDQAMQIYDLTNLEKYDKIGYYNRGIILFNKQKYEESIQLFNKITNFDPFRYNSLIQKGHSLLWLGRIKEGIQMYNEAIQLNKDKMDYFKRAEYFHIRYQFKRAIKMYDMAIKLDPQHFQSYLQKGDALYSIGREMKSMICYKLALDHNPNIEEFLKRGHIFEQKKQYQRAIYFYDIMIQIDPKFYLGYLKKGNSLKALGLEYEANQIFKIVIELHPNMLNYVDQGYRFLEQKCYHNAIKQYDQVLNLIPNYYLGYFLKGFALTLLENFEEAIQLIDISIRLNISIRSNPQNDDAYFYKGYALQRLERFQDALQWYHFAKYNKANSHLCIDYKELILRRQKNNESDQAYKNQNSTYCYQNKVWLLYEFGKYDEAFQAMLDFNQNQDCLPNQRYQELKNYK